MGVESATPKAAARASPLSRRAKTIPVPDLVRAKLNPKSKTWTLISVPNVHVYCTYYVVSEVGNEHRDHSLGCGPQRLIFVLQCACKVQILQTVCAQKLYYLKRWTPISNSRLILTHENP